MCFCQVGNRKKLATRPTAHATLTHETHAIPCNGPPSRCRRHRLFGGVGFGLSGPRYKVHIRDALCNPRTWVRGSGLRAETCVSDHGTESLASGCGECMVTGMVPCWSRHGPLAGGTRLCVITRSHAHGASATRPWGRNTAESANLAAHGRGPALCGVIGVLPRAPACGNAAVAWLSCLSFNAHFPETGVDLDCAAGPGVSRLLRFPTRAMGMVVGMGVQSFMYSPGISQASIQLAPKRTT